MYLREREDLIKPYIAFRAHLFRKCFIYKTEIEGEIIRGIREIRMSSLNGGRINQTTDFCSSIQMLYGKRYENSKWNVSRVQHV